MKRSYVPIYQDKIYNAHIFYDYETNEFFTTSQKKQNSWIPYASGSAGIIFYSYFQSKIFDAGLTPLTMALLSIVVGAIIAYASLKLIMKATNESLKTQKVVLSLTNNQVREYLNESKKQLKSMLLMVLFLLILSLSSSLILFFVPVRVMFMIIAPVFWARLIIMACGIRPIKRRQVVNQLLKEYKYVCKKESNGEAVTLGRLQKSEME